MSIFLRNLMNIRIEDEAGTFTIPFNEVSMDASRVNIESLAALSDLETEVDILCRWLESRKKIGNSP